MPVAEATWIETLPVEVQGSEFQKMLTPYVQSAIEAYNGGRSDFLVLNFDDADEANRAAGAIRAVAARHGGYSARIKFGSHPQQILFRINGEIKQRGPRSEESKAAARAKREARQAEANSKGAKRSK